MAKCRSSNVYVIDPLALRRLKVEKVQRNRENAFLSHPEFRKRPGETDEDRAHRTAAERTERYDSLKQSIKTNGFDSQYPVELHLNRKDGRDQISKGGGHHRLAIAIELGLGAVPVRFVYAEPKVTPRV